MGFSPVRLKVDAGRERWKRLAALYYSSFVACGLKTQDIVRPEIYQTPIARTVLGVAGGDWHLAVKPQEHLRPFHGIPNAFVYDGSDPDNANEPPGVSAFAGQMTPLRQADAILCTTELSACALRAQGLKNAFFLPPHVPKPDLQPEQPPRDLAGDRAVRLGVFLDTSTPIEAFSEVVQELCDARGKNADLELVVVAPREKSPTGITEWVSQKFGLEAASAVFVIDSDPGSYPTANGLLPIDYVLSVYPPNRLSVELVQIKLRGVPQIDSVDAAMSLLAAAADDGDRRREVRAKVRQNAEDKFGLKAFRTRVADLQDRLRDLPL